MRICASLSNVQDIEHIGAADIVEVRLDIFNSVPWIADKDMLVTFCGAVDLNVLPWWYNGMIDIGMQNIPKTRLTTISSYHNYDYTPDIEHILLILSHMSSDISKVVFKINSFIDLIKILDTSILFKKRHIILGIGTMGSLTRIRQNILSNEFTFGYVGKPTAPGQLSIDKMSTLGDNCMILGIVGYPLKNSKSMMIQNKALRSTNVNGIYIPLEAKSLKGIQEVIRGYEIRGINITMPFKQRIIDYLDHVDDEAYAIGAVNTVVNDRGQLKGYNTDIYGIDVALSIADFDPKDKHVLIIGSGGVARACLYYMTNHGCDIAITSRNIDVCNGLTKEFGVIYHSKHMSIAPYDLIVNCTPVGMHNNYPCSYIIDISSISKRQTVFDMVYHNFTPLNNIATLKGCKIVSGADMLAGQGSKSFLMWTGIDGSFDIMRKELI